MKIIKFLNIVLCMFLLTGCFSKKESILENKEETVEKEEVTEDVYEDANTIKIGLYDNVGRKFIRYNSYNKIMKSDVDLDTYQVVFSGEEELKYNGNRQDFIKSLWDNIGYDFTLGIVLEYDTENEGHIKHVIYKPDNTLEYQRYFGVYLYDAISHRNDKWYSHITKEEFNDNSYITSFKLTPGKQINEVTSPLKISVFTYDSEDDFDLNGNYRGNSIYTILVTNG